MTALFFFNELEAATIEAVTARVFPGDPASPGAREAGVVDYIDRAIAGFSTELQPLYRRGIVELDRLAVTRHGGPFRDLTEEDQDALLAGLDGSAHSEPGSGERGATDLLVRFFAVVREHTLEGMFGDPAYGGNRDAVGWRLIGFPGAQYGYTAEQMRPGFDATDIPVATLEDLRRDRHPGRPDMAEERVR